MRFALPAVTYPSRHACDTDRPCESCGEPFHPKRSDARFCSPRCRTRHSRGRPGLVEPVMCASNVCLEDFYPTRSDQRYCSPRCRQAALRERRDDADFTEWLVTGGLDFLRNGAGGPDQTNDEEA